MNCRLWENEPEKGLTLTEAQRKGRFRLSGIDALNPGAHDLGDVRAEIQRESASSYASQATAFAEIAASATDAETRAFYEGKAEEYKHRKNFALEDSSEYDIHSYADAGESGQTTFSPESEMLMEDERYDDAAANNAAAPVTTARDTAASNGGLTYELFARATCPNCPPVKEWIANSGLAGRSIDVDSEAGLAEAAQKGVFAAPTVIFYKADGSESARAHNVAELEEIFNLETA